MDFPNISLILIPDMGDLMCFLVTDNTCPNKVIGTWNIRGPILHCNVHKLDNQVKHAFIKWGQEACRRCKAIFIALLLPHVGLGSCWKHKTCQFVSIAYCTIAYIERCKMPISLLLQSVASTFVNGLSHSQKHIKSPISGFNMRPILGKSIKRNPLKTASQNIIP